MVKKPLKANKFISPRCLSRLRTLIDLIRRKHIRSIFAESSVNSKLIANLVRETGVHLGGTLYADGLGIAGSDAATYEMMIKHNARTIVEAVRPWHLKLRSRWGTERI